MSADQAKHAVDDIPLADDESAPTSAGLSAKHPKPPEPLPLEYQEEDQEEKARLISHVLELQNTLDGACRLP